MQAISCFPLSQVRRASCLEKAEMTVKEGNSGAARGMGEAVFPAIGSICQHVLPDLERASAKMDLPAKSPSFLAVSVESKMEWERDVCLQYDESK
jgi:hypothetical protein